jgi:NRAMP (natural resistance-associated macrophage protein)-like metal ion transporter
MVLQHLSVKLGVVAERDLAQACRDHFSPTTNFILWIFCEIAIAACDLAEVIGSAIALNLLFIFLLPGELSLQPLMFFSFFYFSQRFPMDRKYCWRTYFYYSRLFCV